MLEPLEDRALLAADFGFDVSVSEPVATLTVDNLPASLAVEVAEVRTGIVSGATNTAWTTVTLDRSYTSMVVILTPNYASSSVPLVPRVRNASGSSFQVQVDRTDGSTAAVAGIDVHYLVMEEGVYTVADHGVKMEAVKFTSTVTDRVGSWNGEARSYANTYTNPVVVGQVMTDNDPDFSVFWSRGGSQSEPPSSSVLRVGKHVGEDPDTTRSNETIGYVVIESGSGSMGGLNYVAALGANTIRGMDNGPPFSYSLSGLSSVSAAVVSQSAMDGSNGSWAVLYGANPVSTSSLNLAVDEDQANDSERTHLAEQVAYIVLVNIVDNDGNLNRAPVARSDTFILGPPSGPLDSFGTVLANDLDADGDPLTAALARGPAAGSVALGADGSFTYTRGAAFVAVDHFDYRVQDGRGGVSVATATLLSHDASLVRKLYLQVLGREAEDSGLSFWAGRIGNGEPMSIIAEGIFESNERLNPIVSQYYRDFLLREPEPQGLAFWRDLVWKRDGGPDNVIAGMIESPEFFRSAGGTNRGWVTELYRRLLDREPEESGLQFWETILNENRMTRQQVVLGFVRSDENFRNLVRGWWQSHLGRQPTWVEEERAVQQMRGGASQRQIQIQVFDNPEFTGTVPLPEPGTARPADITAFAVADENGRVSLQVDGRSLEFVLIDEGTLQPLNDYAASFALDPYSRQAGVLTLIDLRHIRRPRYVVVTGPDTEVAGQSAALADSPQPRGVQASAGVVRQAEPPSPIPISLPRTADLAIPWIVTEVFQRQALGDFLKRAVHVKNGAVLALKVGAAVRGEQGNLPLGETRPGNLTAGEAFQEILADVGKNALTDGAFFLLTRANPLSWGGAVIDVGNILWDTGTVVGCGLSGQSVSVTGLRGLGSNLYACTTPQTEQEPLVQVDDPTAADISNGSLELFRQANAGQLYVGAADGNGNLTANVPPGRYKLQVRAPGRDPHTETVDVPPQGLTLKPLLSLNPGTTERVSISTPVSNTLRLAVGQQYNIHLATATGGFPPYTFLLDSGIGFQPLGMQLVTEGDKLFLRGSPSPGSESPFARKFGVCVKDLSGNSDCLNRPLSYVVTGISVTPTSGLVTDEFGATASFSVVLKTPPTADVRIGLASSDATEAAVSPASLTFTPANWSTPQIVTVTGLNDFDVDGNIPYSIITSPAVSGDPGYSGANPPDVALVNVDNDATSPTPDTTGTWIGPGSLVNPLCNYAGTMTLTLQAFPQFTTVVTGDLVLDMFRQPGSGSGCPPRQGGSSDIVGTVKGTRVVLNARAGSGFILWQMVGEVHGNHMFGETTIIDTSGGRTTGPFSLTHVSRLQAADESPAPASGTPAEPPTRQDLAAAVDESLARWATLGVNVDRARQVDVQVLDLPGSTLGAASGNTIYLDDDAAGRGWFVDPTPWLDEEFLARASASHLAALPEGPAQQRVDLLTVVFHEMGHLLGLDHAAPADPFDLMASTLGRGERRLG